MNSKRGGGQTRKNEAPPLLHLPPHVSGLLFSKTLKSLPSTCCLQCLPFHSHLNLPHLGFYLLLPLKLFLSSHKISRSNSQFSVLIYSNSQQYWTQSVTLSPKNTFYSWLPGDPMLLFFSLCTGCCFSAFSSHWPFDLGPSGAQFLEFSFSIYTPSFGGLNYMLRSLKILTLVWTSLSIQSLYIHLPSRYLYSESFHFKFSMSCMSYWSPNPPTCMLLLSRFSRVGLCATPWTAAYQASPSMGFSRQEHWSGLPFPSPMHESGKWNWSRSVVSDS